MTEDKGLKSIREKIDSIDEKILSLINERAALAIAAGKAKGDSSKYKPSREASIYNKLKEINPGPLTTVQIISIYKEIISSCRSTEADFKVSFLGPEGTYSESAMTSQFGDSVKKNAEEKSGIQNVGVNKWTVSFYLKPRCLLIFFLWSIFYSLTVLPWNIGKDEFKVESFNKTLYKAIDEFPL